MQGLGVAGAVPRLLSVIGDSPTVVVVAGLNGVLLLRAVCGEKERRAGRGVRLVPPLSRLSNSNRSTTISDETGFGNGSLFLAR